MYTLRECNDSLKTEVAQLKSQLSHHLLMPVSDAVIQEREQFISQLEEYQEKISCLERQVQSLEDEKDDLVTEKTFFFEKCNTLERCLEEKGRDNATPPPSESLVEAVVEENRQLNLKILGLQAERDQALNRIERYKRAQQRLKDRDSSQLQIVHFSNHHTVHQESQKAAKRLSELETLANSLSESVKEKSIALAHQREANKILAAKITELERRIKTLELSGLLPQSSCLGEEGEASQLWHEGLEEDVHSKDEHAEQLRETLSLSGAKKLATDSACHVEVA
eukprot:Em0013g890a